MSIASLKAASAVAPIAEFNKAGGDLVADELVQRAYNWFNSGWYARHLANLDADDRAAARGGVFVSVELLKRAQKHVPYLGETYQMIDAALGSEKGE